MPHTHQLDYMDSTVPSYAWRLRTSHRATYNAYTFIIDDFLLLSHSLNDHLLSLVTPSTREKVSFTTEETEKRRQELKSTSHTDKVARTANQSTRFATHACFKHAASICNKRLTSSMPECCCAMLSSRPS